MTATDDPTPPTNVRLELADGSTVPVECVYEGVVDGLHRWLAVHPVALGVGVAHLRVDAIPPRTAVTVGVRP